MTRTAGNHGPRPVTRRMQCPTIVLLAVLCSLNAGAQAAGRQRDRGPGIPTSMFGTYIEKGELILYPFFEQYIDRNAEYKPAELGYGVESDYRGRRRASEALVFLGYGLTDRLAIEMEAAVITERLDKSPADPSVMPSYLRESGLGDVEGQLRYRWSRETNRAPEFFSYFETVLPLQKDRRLIGTPEWQFKLGSGMVRGFSFGTVTARAAVEYDATSANVALGEVALEFLRRVNSRLRLYAGVEGTDDEYELIGEVQWTLRPGLVLKLNNAVGITSKATDWAPEIGIAFSFRR